MRSVDREGTLELGPDYMRDGNETGPLSETAGRIELVRHQKAGASPAEKVARKEIMEQWQHEAQGGETDGRKERRTINNAARSVQCGEADCRKKYRAFDSTICRTAAGPEDG